MRAEFFSKFRHHRGMATAASELTEEGITVSYDRWPIVVMKIHPNFNLEDIDAAYEGLMKWVESGQKRIYWTDLLEVNPLTANARARQRFADWEAKLHPIAQGSVVAEVRVVEGTVVRGILRAFDWISKPPPWPVGTFANDAEAHAWLEEIGAMREVEGSVRPT